jgi:hypothetical protein
MSVVERPLRSGVFHDGRFGGDRKREILYIVRERAGASKDPEILDTGSACEIERCEKSE